MNSNYAFATLTLANVVFTTGFPSQALKWKFFATNAFGRETGIEILSKRD